MKKTFVVELAIPLLLAIVSANFGIFFLMIASKTSFPSLFTSFGALMFAFGAISFLVSALRAVDLLPKSNGGQGAYEPTFKICVHFFKNLQKLAILLSAALTIATGICLPSATLSMFFGAITVTGVLVAIEVSVLLLTVAAYLCTPTREKPNTSRA
jgi:hypothetical protein